MQDDKWILLALGLITASIEMMRAVIDFELTLFSCVFAVISVFTGFNG